MSNPLRSLMRTSNPLQNITLFSLPLHICSFFSFLHLKNATFIPLLLKPETKSNTWFLSLTPCSASASSTGTASNHSICQMEPLPSRYCCSCCPNSRHLTWTNSHLDRYHCFLPAFSAPLAPLFHSATRVVLLPLKWTEASPHVKLPEGVPLLFGSGRLLLLNAHHSHCVSCHHVP